MGTLAEQHHSINLAQGIPDLAPSPLILEAVTRAVRDGLNQYSPPAGVLPLRAAISEHADRFYAMHVDPETMVSVTVGASGAIFATMMALVEPGDEVVAFDPSYESYEPNVRMAGGVFRRVPLEPPDASHDTWWFSRHALEAAIGPRTKALLLNTPHNPTGKVFTQSELEIIAELAERHDFYVVTDEVYEHIAFAPAHHVRFATLPGMAARTITIAAASKTFSVTGWRIGWVISSPALIPAIRYTHQTFVYSAPTPFQIAIAAGLRLEDSYYQELEASYVAHRDALCGLLYRAGIRPYETQGAYFTNTDVRELGFNDDVEFCNELTTDVGVTPLPCSAFFDPKRSNARAFARFSFCRSIDVITSAIERLARFHPRA